MTVWSSSRGFGGDGWHGMGSDCWWIISIGMDRRIIYLGPVLGRHSTLSNGAQEGHARRERENGTDGIGIEFMVIRVCTRQWRLLFLLVEWWWCHCSCWCWTQILNESERTEGFTTFHHWVRKDGWLDLNWKPALLLLCCCFIRYRSIRFPSPPTRELCVLAALMESKSG